MTPMTPRSGVAVVVVLAVVVSAVSAAGTQFELLGAQQQLDERLERLEANQNLMRSRMPRWETHLEQILQRLERVEAHLTSAASCGSSGGGGGGDTAAAVPQALPQALQVMAYESIASKVDGLALDTHTAIDHRHEKMLLVDQRLGQHERQSQQQLERLVSATESGLEMTAAFRAESAAEARRHLRAVEAKLAALSTMTESRLQRLALQPAFVLGGAANSTTATASITSSANVINYSTSQVAGGLGAHRASGKGGRAGGAVRDGGGGGLAALIDALRPRPVKATPASAKGSGRTSATTRRTAANDTVVMDQDSRVVTNGSTTTWNEPSEWSGWRHYLEQQGSTLTHKLANMYDQLWRQSKASADQLHLVGQTVNQSKWHMDEGFRTVLEQLKGWQQQAAPPPATSLDLRELDLLMGRWTERLERLLEDRLAGWSCPSEWDGWRLVTEALQGLLEQAGRDADRGRALADELAELHHLADKHHEQSIELLLKLYHRQPPASQQAESADYSYVDAPDTPDAPDIPDEDA